MKVISWTQDEWKKNLQRRLHFCKKARKSAERVARENEKILFTDIGQYPDQIVVTEENLLRFDTGEMEVGQEQIGINYSWKYVRFLHSQMSANPPSVLFRPTSTDVSDRRSADAADRVGRHLGRKLTVQEIVDQANLATLVYGNGYVRTKWNPMLGDIAPDGFNEATGEILMEGDHDCYSPNWWNIWLDYQAKSWAGSCGVRFFFEKFEYPMEEAAALFPDDKDSLDRYARTRAQDYSDLDKDKVYDDVVDIYEYVEKGLALNGMAGRRAFCLEDGTVLGKPSHNPHPAAGLGLHRNGDSDVPGQLYDKTFVEYVVKLQDVLNRLDSTLLDNVEAHGVIRMVLPEGADVEDEAVSNHAFDYIKIVGNSGNGPYFPNPPQLMPDLWRFREQLVQGMQELAGINDSMLGQVKREMSGFSIQTAIDAGNMVRRRLFNKYTAMVESIYRDLLAIAQEHWTLPQEIQVVGKERAFETTEFSRADITGGFDVVAEYGASLSLDPSRRREEIQQIKGDLKEAGVSMRTIVGMYRLNELETLYDRVEIAGMRMREIFDKIIAKETAVDVEPNMDHAGMLEFANEYVMSAEFRDLPQNLKDLINDHIEQRRQAAAQQATGGQMAPPTAGGGPQPGGPQLVPEAPTAAAPTEGMPNAA